MAPRYLAGLEGLDDDHGSAATRAGLLERLSRVIGLGIGIGFVLRRLYGEQLTGPGEVLGTPAVGKEAVMADAVEA